MFRLLVGIKSFSITRLKLIQCNPLVVRQEAHRWNQKFLDYEIETPC